MYQDFYKKNNIIIGVDEVGRGSLIGDVVVCAAVAGGSIINGISDSKTIQPNRRRSLYKEIAESNNLITIARAKIAEIERYNVLNATLKAMSLAIGKILDIINPTLKYKSKFFKEEDVLTIDSVSKPHLWNRELHNDINEKILDYYANFSYNNIDLYLKESYSENSDIGECLEYEGHKSSEKEVRHEAYRHQISNSSTIYSNVSICNKCFRASAGSDCIRCSVISNDSSISCDVHVNDMASSHSSNSYCNNLTLWPNSNHDSVSNIIVLVDGNKIPNGWWQEFVSIFPIVKGDMKIYEIGMASIFAKETRDQEIRDIIHPMYPEYKWDKNFGYGTREHINAIMSHGITKFHRPSFVSNFTFSSSKNNITKKEIVNNLLNTKS